jgi:NAD(P)-dependent dehydrogenase (short-subunit alcohol dehydrogenase family)
MSEATQKVALVTGSARGIGLATAKRFLADGWRVVLLDIDGENLKRTFTALNKPDVTLALVCDREIRARCARPEAHLIPGSVKVQDHRNADGI